MPLALDEVQQELELAEVASVSEVLILHGGSLTGTPTRASRQSLSSGGTRAVARSESVSAAQVAQARQHRLRRLIEPNVRMCSWSSSDPG